ncbi:hypothetical protein D3C76_853670 [compost metagenome]
MADDHGLLFAECVDQLDHVAYQVERGVGVGFGRRICAAIAAHVGRYRSVAGGRQRSKLVAPRVPQLRESVA